MGRRAKLSWLFATIAAAALSVAYGCSSFGSDDAPEKDAGSDTGASDAGASDTGAAPRSLHVVYARSFGAMDDASSIFPGRIAVGTAGDAHIIGSYEGAAFDIDGHPLKAPIDLDTYILDLATSGETTNVRAYGTEGSQIGTAATVGNAFFAGVTFEKALQIGSVGHKAIGPFNALVARLGAGTVAEYVLSGTGNIQLRALALGSGGSVVASGEWTADLALSSDPGAPSTSTAAGASVYVTRLFPPAGESEVLRVFCDQGTITCTAPSVATNGAGDSALAGRFSGNVTFGDTGALSSSDGDAYVVGLDPKLTPKWVLALGGVGNQESFAVASIPNTSDFVVTGGFEGILDVPGKSKVMANNASRDIFVARIDPLGKLVWLRTFGGNGDDKAFGIAVDAKSNIFFAGDFKSTSIDFGGGPLVNGDAMGLGTADAFVVWLDGDGNHVYSTRFGGSATHGLGTIAVDGEGHPFIAGSFTGSLDLGDVHLRAKSGRGDLFVAKLSP